MRFRLAGLIATLIGSTLSGQVPSGMIGRWQTTSIERNGVAEPRSSPESWVVTAKELRILLGETVIIGGPVSFRQGISPSQLDIDVTEAMTASTGKKTLGIYQQVGDELTVCMTIGAAAERQRPTALKTQKGDPWACYRLRRAAK